MNGTQETLRSYQKSAQSARTEAGTKKTLQKLEGRKATVRGDLQKRFKELCYYRSPLYMKWYSMIGRCYNPKDMNYRNYGARGIKVCKEWKVSRNAFLMWAVENGYEEGLQIDKIDNDGDYSPENCRFITHYENQHNRQPTRRSNSSGYNGVNKFREGYRAYITDRSSNGKKSIHIGCYPTKKAALEARNKYIRDNNLPHQQQEYHGE